MREAVTAILLAVGSAFMLLAAVGITKFPDLFTRMQTTAKAATLGVICMILAAAVHFGDFGTAVSALLIIAFFLLTAPVAAHVIARAAYSVGVPLWEGSVMDELRARREGEPEGGPPGPGDGRPEGPPDGR